MRNVSARLYLLGLITVAVVPVWLFAAFVIGRYAFSERERFELDAVQVASQVSLLVEAELRSLLRLLDTVLRSTSSGPDYADALEVEARRIVQGTGRNIMVREAGGRQLFNTAVPEGQPLPRTAPLPQDWLEQTGIGTPFIGGVHTDEVTGDVRVSLGLTLLSPDDEVWLAELSIPTAAIRDVMVQAVPAGWIVAVGDAEGAYVARSELHDDLTGRPGLPEYVERVVGRSGTFTAGNLQGVTLLAGYVRSDFSRWFYTANIPLDVVQGPLFRSLVAIGSIGLLAMALSTILAFFVGDRFAAAAGELVEKARALGRGEPVSPPASSISEFAVIGSALVAAEQAIAERARELEAVVDTVPAAVWFTYDPTARSVIRNRFASELMEIPTAGLPFGRVEQVTDTRAYKDGIAVSRDERPLSLAMRGELTDNEEFVYVLPSGVQRVLLSSARPIRNASGMVIGAVQVSLDISERKRGEEQRKLLVNELNHRVKNTLAVVQSIVSQTLRTATDIPEANAALASRFGSLARAHDILTAGNWAGADIRTLIAACVRAHAPDERFRIQGQALDLPPALSLSLTLALHELTTNALKYGALSNEAGVVTIEWSVEEGAGGQHLRLGWMERGGPPVKPATRQGFGTRLLERLLQSEPDGKVTTTFDPAGVVCVLEACINRPGDTGRAPAA